MTVHGATHKARVAVISILNGRPRARSTALPELQQATVIQATGHSPRGALLFAVEATCQRPLSWQR